jgi:hypothetical protein
MLLLALDVPQANPDKKSNLAWENQRKSTATAPSALEEAAGRYMILCSARRISVLLHPAESSCSVGGFSP